MYKYFTLHEANTHRNVLIIHGMKKCENLRKQCKTTCKVFIQVFIDKIFGEMLLAKY